jgi:SPP1 family predicted phage head-tail adaptor
MKHQITLTSATALDSTGAPGAPTSSAPIWAFISALQGRDLNLAQQIISTVTHKIVIPYQDGITAAMTVLYGTRTFQVNAVQDPDEGQFELWLMCTEINKGEV